MLAHVGHLGVWGSPGHPRDGRHSHSHPARVLTRQRRIRGVECHPARPCLSPGQLSIARSGALLSGHARRVGCGRQRTARSDQVRQPGRRRNPTTHRPPRHSPTHGQIQRDHPSPLRRGAVRHRLFLRIAGRPHLGPSADRAGHSARTDRPGPADRLHQRRGRHHDHFPRQDGRGDRGTDPALLPR